MKNINAIILNISLFLFSVFPSLVHASSTGMPWESPVEKVVNSITGPIAFGIAVLGIVAAGGTLIFGNADLSGFIKMLIGVVLVIAFIVLAVNILSSVFGISSTLVI